MMAGNDSVSRGISSRFVLQRLIILLVMSLIISFFLFPNIVNQPSLYKLGDVADRDIKATRDILIENKELTARDTEKAVNEVPYVYDFDPSASDMVLKIKEAMSEARASYILNSLSAEVDKGIGINEIPVEIDIAEKNDIKDVFFKTLEISPHEDLFERLITNSFSTGIEESLIQLVTKIYDEGIVGNKTVLMSQSQKGVVLQSLETGEETLITDLNRFHDIEGAKDFIKGQRDSLITDEITSEEADLAVNVALTLIKPNVTFNKRETELRKNIASESVKPSYYQIKVGEMLVREGERIGPDHLLKLSGEAESIGRKDMLRRVPGMTILIGILFAIVYMAGLIQFRSSGDDLRHLLFNTVTLLGVFIFVWAYNLIAEEIARGFASFTTRALLFALPVACGSMLITVFQGAGMATTFSLLISILAALAIDANMDFFIYFFINSLFASYWVRDYRERGILIKTGLKVGLINMLLCLLIESIYGSLFTLEILVALPAAFIGGVLAGIITTGIIPLFEMAFGFTTDLKLMELSNLDQPLLKDLMVQAPGTYHHSVIVSNMVEATAEAIKANPLLAKVSAYYHDIGKMKKPLYFIENQMGCENKHEKLAPSMSSLVLISHVKDGVELAKEHKLGREIIDIIEQHQGKGLITYFYQKAKEQTANKGKKASQVKEEDFRYPGPKPQTKEAGLVMLADMVEAASRSLPDPTPARIQGTVQKIINKVFSDGQLDECELTLKDLHEIAKSFNKTLSGIFHQRVEYPEMDLKNVKKGTNGDTDQVPSEDSGSKRSDIKEEDKEGLKRLGL
jgi:putative nucleotidyltransferase with HDIG domain